jgi:beta-lactamase regulating signal transducer with metallopeptidase domain
MTLIADALSAALVHSLWQNAIVAIVFWLALAVLSERSANARYAISCAALAVMVAVPIVTTGVVYARALPPDLTATIIVASPAVISSGSISVGSIPVTGDAQQGHWIPWLQAWALPVWLIGILAFSVRFLSASAHAITLKRRSDPAGEALASIVSALAVRLGVTRSVTVLISTIAGSPATLGWIRPVILLPPATALGLTPRQLEALLAHELAHIRRHDYLVNLLQMMVETVFFYHPAVWWASRRIRAERELCCDDIAIDASGDALSYAQALTRVARLRMATAEMALGASGGPLLRRIQRILGIASAGTAVSPAWLIAAALVIAVAVTLTGAGAQSPTPGMQTSVTGAGVLRGVVIDAQNGSPVVGARVQAQSVSGVGNPIPCAIDDCHSLDKMGEPVPMYRQSTGTGGRFEIRGVRPGEYWVGATAPGYILRHFGQTSGDTPEITVRVSAGQTASAVDIRLERAGAVTGHVFSDSGDGLAGVEVELLRRSYVLGGARPVPVAFAQTENRGVYRFRDVAPGEYYVRAYVSGAIRPTRPDKSVAYAATFFPEAPDIEMAQPLVVVGGQEVFGIDLPLATMKLRVVSGRLVDPAGQSLATARVRLVSRSSGSVETAWSAVTRDGRFRLEDVVPGDYMLLVVDTADSRRWNGGLQEISVIDDVTDVMLVASPGASIEGRIVRGDGRPLPFDVSDLDISLHHRFASGASIGAGRTDVRADGTFAIQSGAGTMHLDIAGLPAPWNLKVAMLNGLDVTDRPFELGEGSGHRLDITLTDRVVHLLGDVTDRSARPVSNALVVVFPEDRSRWQASRLIRTTFSHQQGRYELGDLPAGDYRVAAVATLPRRAWMDPAVLDRLWRSSAPVRLQEDQQQAVSLKVIPALSDLTQ